MRPPLGWGEILHLSGRPYVLAALSAAQSMRKLLSPLLDQHRPPKQGFQQWNQLATTYAVQWKQLVKRFLSKTVQMQQFQWQMGERMLSDEHWER